MTYDEIDADLEARFPRLVKRLEEERKFWAPDPVGVDILLASIFVPYLVNAVRRLPSTNDIVSAAAEFIEELATSDHQDLQEAARFSVLQALEDYPSDLAVLVPRLGPWSRSLLPTRG